MAEAPPITMRMQAWVYFVTWIQYAANHITRKCYTNVKNVMIKLGLSKMVLGRMDAGFMFTYAFGAPLAGQLGDMYDPSMVLGGAFDRLPTSLRLCFAHGGGSFAFLLGRLENAYRHRDIARGKASRPPSAYVERFSCDSAVFDERSLRCLVDVMGVERVMLGSDYPFPLGEQRVGSLVRGAEFLSQADKDAILGGNAREFFNLSV